jgi:6-phosphogluconate dehydrogenase
MQLGMIGLGRMGANMVRRLLRAGHECVVNDRSPEAVKPVVDEGAIGAASLDAFIAKLTPPRAIWLMIPAALVDTILDQLVTVVSAGDIIIDGGNSYYIDDIRRAHELKAKGIHYVDVGTSGGVWGLERGYCQMIGGETEVVTHLDPIFKALAPGRDVVSATPGRAPDAGSAAEGYLHCGPAGAGHFVKMVHNGIEYGLMAAYAEGLNVLHHANVGKVERTADAETTPHRNPEHYQYDFNLADITEVWRRGSVIASWLLDLTAIALAKRPQLDGFSGRVSDSGEGRWTVNAAVEEGVPVPVLSAALFQRFSSRGEADFANKVLSAMRLQFGGHAERHVDQK